MVHQGEPGKLHLGTGASFGAPFFLVQIMKNLNQNTGLASGETGR
jgi:hypothetical protein